LSFWATLGSDLTKTIKDSCPRSVTKATVGRTALTPYWATLTRQRHRFRQRGAVADSKLHLPSISQSGWYFQSGTTHSMPLTGNPAYNPGNNGFTNDNTGAYRLFPTEVISFGQRLRFTIQHGPTDDEPANYSPVAVWYDQPTYSLRVTDALNTTDYPGRATHQTSCNRILEVFGKKKEPGVYPAVLF
jgi:hypothetical protein